MIQLTKSPLRIATLVLVVLGIGTPAPPLAAEPIDAATVVAPNPATDWLAARIRDSIIKRLDLDEAQLRSIHDLIDRHQDSLWSEIVTVKETRLMLIERIRSAPVDREAIRHAHDVAASKELNLLLHGAVILQEMRQILTEEQMAEGGLLLDELREAAEQHFDNLEERFAAGELLGKKWRRRAYRGVAR